jgi:hypothetical protein
VGGWWGTERAMFCCRPTGGIARLAKLALLPPPPHIGQLANYPPRLARSGLEKAVLEPISAPGKAVLPLSRGPHLLHTTRLYNDSDAIRLCVIPPLSNCYRGSRV